MKGRYKDKLLSNKGSGLAVILYGVTLLLVLLFTAINFVNAKVIEDGYNSLRDAVQAASSGSVIHLLTSNREEATSAQKQVIEKASYDIYLQLALGYLINRDTSVNKNDDTTIQTGEINNFIKLDHQKVVNSTLALMEDAIYRRRGNGINNTDEYKILMFFIEPYHEANGKKYFDIIAYGNGNYDGTTITSQLAIERVERTSSADMKNVYGRVEESISRMVNQNYAIKEGGDNFSIKLNSQGSNNYEGLIREMETYPHYLIVVKDFALPTIFDGVETNDAGSGIRSAFRKTFDFSGGSTLKTPMCALNTGKVQRQYEEAGWSQDR